MTTASTCSDGALPLPIRRLATYTTGEKKAVKTKPARYQGTP